MKKFVLLTVSLMLVITLYAQQNTSIKDGLKTAIDHPEQAIAIENVTKQAPVISAKFDIPEQTKSTNLLNIFAIGSAANAYSYGYAGGQKTILWVDDHLNAVTNTHRMTSETYSGNLAMDLSLDGGATFENNIMVYESNEPGPTYNVDAIRYPHGAIYNPMGNMDPANSYLFYFGPILDGSNSPDTWGGYGYGVANLVDHEDTTKHNRPANPDEGYYQYIPEAFTVTQDGIAWVVDPADDWTSGSLNYTDKLVVNKGTFDPEEGDIEYEGNLMDFEVPDNPDLFYVMNEKVAFAPDGQTGYMVLLTNDGSVDFSENAVYPCIFKTIDGGENWEYMDGIQLGGEDGIERVKQYLSDEQLAQLFDPVPDRDEILFTTAFDFDLVVDHTGNPHIGVVIGVAGANPFSIVTEPYTFAAFDIFSTDGGLTWTGLDLKKLANFRGEFGGLTEDNRIQASATMDGEKVFISWLETDPGFSENNDMPDIRGVGLDMVAHTYTDTLNVTELTVAWLQSFFFAAPHYMLTDNDQYTIPFTYEDMDPADPTKEVTYMYIQDFSITDGDFVNEFPDGVGIDDTHPATNKAIVVSQNYPNPFSGETSIEVTTDKSLPVQMKIYSLTGQLIHTEDAGNVTGSHQFSFDGSMLSPGIYFYSIEAGDETITRKMTLK